MIRNEVLTTSLKMIITAVKQIVHDIALSSLRIEDFLRRILDLGLNTWRCRMGVG